MNNLGAGKDNGIPVFESWIDTNLLLGLQVKVKNCPGPKIEITFFTRPVLVSIFQYCPIFKMLLGLKL